jgi:hypothetical protein
MQNTLLSIAGIDFSEYSVRAITMTMTPIEQASQARYDCRGILRDLSLAQFRRYEATITCTDHEAPELTDVWPGDIVDVTFIPHLGVTGTSAGDPITLSMMVIAWNTSREEWESETAWELTLREVGEDISA